MTTTSNRIPIRPILLAVSLLVSGAASATPAAEDTGYGFYRTVEGDVRLTTLEREEPLDIEPNYPLLLGDRVWVAASGRLEAILPDQTIVRFGGGTDLHFEELALYAGDTESFGTVLRLLEGEIQVVIPDYRRHSEALRVDTNNAVLYLQEAGRYRIYADDHQWTELVVREGFGEVLLADGSVVVRADEEAVIDGSSDSRARVYPAGALDALEAWGESLDREAYASAHEGYVDDSLRYSAAPLDGHGEWLPMESGYAWRPYSVASSWRPYTRGYWTHTPAGLYWVSYEPWGAVTAHYGSWYPHPHYGWVWYPGRVFSPAWVHWYWGSSYVGWVPSGYYSHYYGHHRRGYGSGLRFGVYGWASGSWGFYADWTFCPTRYFGWRSYHSTWRSGRDIGRTARHDVPRGVITSDTSGIPRESWGRPDRVVRHLTEDRIRIHAVQELGDVTHFVARKPELTRETQERVFARPGESRSPVRVTRRVPSAVRTERESVGAEREAQAVAIERRMPVTPERSRTDLVRGSRSIPTAGESEIRSPSAVQRLGPPAREPSRVSPELRERVSRDVGRESVARELERRESAYRPGAGAERTTAQSPGQYIRQVQPVSPAAPSTSAPSAGPSTSSTGRVPVVRRVLDGLRRVSPGGSSGSTSAAPSTRQPTASAPSPSPSRRPTPSASSPRPSRPSGSSIQRGPSRDVSSGSKGKASSSGRGKSRSKGKPPKN